MLPSARWLATRVIERGAPPFLQGGFPMTGHAIHIKLDGRTYSGTHKVDRQVLTVTRNFGRKAAQVATRQPHESLALQLLDELVREEKAREARHFDEDESARDRRRVLLLSRTETLIC